MAAFREVLKKRRQKGSSLISSVGSTALDKTKEMLDIRNVIFKKGSLLNALFPSIKGFKAESNVDSKNLKELPTNVEKSVADNLMIEKLNIISKNTQIASKNSIVLPSMARDMFLVKENIIKLVKLQGGSPRIKSGDWFSRQLARENAYESQLGKKETSPQKMKQDNQKEKGFFDSFLGFLAGFLGGGIFSFLLKGGLITGILYAIGAGVEKFFTDKEFRERIIDSFVTFIKSDFAQKVLLGLGIAMSGFVAFKIAVGVLTATIMGAAARIATMLGLGSIGVPVPGKGKRGVPVPRKGGKVGKNIPTSRRELITGLSTSIAGGFLGYNLTKDDETQTDFEMNGVDQGITGLESGITSDQGMTGFEGALTGVGAGLGVYGAKKYIQPKLQTPINRESVLSGKVKNQMGFNEKAGRFTEKQVLSSGKSKTVFTSVKGIPLEKVLEWLRNYYIKIDKTPGMKKYILKKIVVKFGMSATIKISVFLGSLAAAPFTAGASLLISLASWGLNAFLLYEVYQWLTENEDDLEKSFQMENSKSKIEKQVESDFSSTPEIATSDELKQARENMRISDDAPVRAAAAELDRQDALKNNSSPKPEQNQEKLTELKKQLNVAERRGNLKEVSRLNKEIGEIEAKEMRSNFTSNQSPTPKSAFLKEQTIIQIDREIKENENLKSKEPNIEKQRKIQSVIDSLKSQKQKTLEDNVDRKVTFNSLSREEQNRLLEAQFAAEGNKPKNLAYDLNNPGAMLYSDWMKEFGAVRDDTGRGSGSLKGKFAKFPSLEKGREAQRALWTRNYGDMPLDQAINKWTTGNKNVVGNVEVENYKNKLFASVGKEVSPTETPSPTKTVETNTTDKTKSTFASIFDSVKSFTQDFGISDITPNDIIGSSKILSSITDPQKQQQLYDSIMQGSGIVSGDILNDSEIKRSVEKMFMGKTGETNYNVTNNNQNNVNQNTSQGGTSQTYDVDLIKTLIGNVS